MHQVQSAKIKWLIVIVGVDLLDTNFGFNLAPLDTSWIQVHLFRIHPGPERGRHHESDQHQRSLASTGEGFELGSNVHLGRQV